MAKKKTAPASPFVPAEEQPYQIPDNWCWTYGRMVLETMETQKPTGDIFDYIDIDAIDNQKQMVNNPKRLTVSKAPSRASRKLHAGDTVFSLVRPYLKNIAYIDDSLAHCIASTGFFVCTPKAFLDNHYLFRLMVSPYIVDGLNQHMKGDNSPSIRKDDIEQFPFPIPPLPEQHRIVTRIESLFAKLDEAKEKAQSVVDGFELRKSAILHKAFTGELTEKWRKENGVGLDSWEKLTLNDVAEYKKGPFGSSITKAMFVPKSNNTYKVFEQGNAIRKTTEYGHYYVSEQKYNELKGFAVKAGDIIISCAGTIGEVYKLPAGCEAGIINQALMRVRLFNNINESFFIYYFGEMLKGDIVDQANGTAMKNIPPFKVMKAMPISLPSLLEQKEIVHIIENLCGNWQQAKEAAEAVLDQIDTMKKAILARAFRGELGTNDPAEEWAGEMVKELQIGNIIKKTVGHAL